jgi:hypothetical protein
MSTEHVRWGRGISRYVLIDARQPVGKAVCKIQQRGEKWTVIRRDRAYFWKEDLTLLFETPEDAKTWAYTVYMLDPLPTTRHQ